MIKGRDLTFKYYEKSLKLVLQNLNFEIEGFTVLLGSSGCGKSTLAMVLAGLYPRNTGVLISGTTMLNKKEIHSLTNRQRAQEVSVMFQNADLQFCMSNLRQELTFCLENLLWDRQKVDGQISYATGYLGTEEFLDRPFYTLSGGEKQKCALTCMVALDTKWMIFDEPFANIDPQSSKELIKLLWKLHEDKGIQMLVIDHMPRRWKEYSCKMVQMDGGTKIFPYEGIIHLIEKKPRKIEDQGNAIELKTVSLAQEDKILLRDTSFHVKKGAITAITGKSGCGKTTLLQCLYGKLKYQGEIKVLGRNATKRNFRELCKFMGIVIQNPQSQFAKHTVLEEIQYSLSLWKQDASVEHAIELLDSFGLKTYQKYSPFMLSQGQQRRLAVLSVLCSGQQILLLDEPTYGQDEESLHAIMKLLTDKVEQEGITVLLTTHDESLVDQYCDYHLEMKEGKIEWR